MSGALAKAVAVSPPPDANGMRTGVVVSINSAGTGVTVAMNGGATVPSTAGQYLPCLSSYLPRVGDVVAMFRQDSSWIVLGATSRTTLYSRYTGTGITLSASAWNVLPWGTLAEGPGIPNNGSGIFTLNKPGVWTVTFSATTNNATGLTAGFFGLFKDAATTSNMFYAETQCPVLSNQLSATMSADIASDGTTTVCAAIFPLGGAPSIFIDAAKRTPILTFRLNP